MSLVSYVSKLTITQGQGAGDYFKVLPWQRDFMEGAFAVEGDAALTVARGNGKTTLCAAIADACLRGPLAQPRAEVVCVASTFTQGRILFEHVLAFMDGDHTDKKRYRVNNTMQAASIEDLERGSRVRCIGSLPHAAHGLAPLLVLADEPAKWEKGKREAMFAALETAMGKIPGSRMIALGTMPEDEDHPFTAMLAGGCDYVQRHDAEPDDDPFDPDVWAKANPSLDHMPHLRRRIKLEAERAKVDEAKLAAFKALRLNMGTPETTAKGTPLVADWTALEVANGSQPDGGYVLGIDAGSRTAMSAATGVWGSGHVDVLAAIGSRATDFPVSDERGYRDSLPVPSIGRLLDNCLTAWGEPVAVVADNYRSDELRAACQERGLPLEIAHTSERADADIAAFEASLPDLIRPDSPLLDHCVAGARVTESAAGRKLARAAEGGRERDHRDDPVSALILAAGMRLRLLDSGGSASGAYLL